MKFPRKFLHGFTLIELLVVVAIIGVLAAAGLAAYSIVLKNARDAKRQTDLKLMQSGLENYFADQKKYPLPNTDSTCSDDTIKIGCALKSLAADGAARVYINVIPLDPATQREYVYKPLKADGTTACASASDCVRYCIYAKSENLPVKIDTLCPDDSNYDIEVTTP